MNIALDAPSDARRSCFKGAVLALISVLAIFTLGLSKTEAGGKPDAPVVKVNGTVLTEELLAEVMQKIVPAASFHGGLSEAKLKKYRPQAIDTLVDDELMFQRAVELSIKVDKKAIKRSREATIRRLGGKKQYKKALKQHGISNREFKKRIRRGLLINKFKKEMIVGQAVLEEGEVRSYYEQNKHSYLRPEARQVRHIFIKVAPVHTDEELEARKKRAESVLEKLDSGEDFATLAWDYSDGPYRVKGGDMGLLHEGRLDRELEEEVEKLGAGEISGLIRTIYGFHIMKVDEIKPEEQLSFEDVGAKIRTSLEQMKLEEVTKRVMSELREKAEIEVLAE